MFNDFFEVLKENHFVEKPVDAKTFVESPDYLGQPPLSEVQYTIVDGKILFDYELDEQLRIHNKKEKARIITKMMDESAKGKSTTPFIPKKNSDSINT